MAGPDFLRALLVVAGAITIGQGIVWIPAVAQLNELVGMAQYEGWLSVGRVFMPITYGALLVILSGPASRLLSPTRAAEPTTGIAGFTESLVGVAGVVIIGLALVDVSEIWFQLTLLDASAAMLNEPASDFGWRPWLQPIGRLVLGAGLILSRDHAGRLIASHQASVAG